MANRLVTLFALVVMSVCTAAQSQNLVGFDRGSFGSIVLSRAQSAGSEVQLELSIGSYENEPIINYRGTIFAEIGRPVGRLDVLTDKGLFPCTAFIVSKKYILTNYHCSLGLLDNEKIGATRIEATQFVAGYVQTGIDEGTNKFTVVPIPVEYSEKLDYAVLEVIGNPSQDYGELKLASMVPNDRTPFWVIGHPQGKGQHISREKCRASSPAVSKTKLLHTCDTLPGNSGSPVIDAGLQVVVALHHAGIANDSVNAAILMSEILANSKVLTAYKAPLSVQQVTPKTSELTACDALYSAATEAKACFAYEAYFKSCEGHALAPIAEGYIDKFCQVQNTPQIEPQPTKTCNQDAKQCGDEQICSLATKNGRWDTSSVNQFYVQEAKKRGLTCRVKAQVKKTCSASTPEVCTATTLCYYAANQSTDKWAVSYKLQGYVKEAKKRGLTCGVKAQVKKTCSASTPEVCTATTLCYYAANQSTNKWAVSYKLQGYVKEAKKRGLTCGVKQVNTFNFKQAFVSQPELKRQQLQYALKKLGYYSYGVDGLWGKGTASGFDEFVKRDGLQSKTAAQVFSSLLSKVTVPSSFESKVAKIPKTSTDKNAPCYLNFQNCTVKQLCITATNISDGQTTWLTTRFPYHVEEAKRRGLNCGVRQNLIPKRVTRNVGSKPMRCFDPSRGIVYSHSPYGMNCSPGDYAISDEDFFKLQGR